MVAVNVIVVPEQIVVADAAIVMEGFSLLMTLTVIPGLVTAVGEAHVALLIN